MNSIIENIGTLTFINSKSYGNHHSFPLHRCVPPPQPPVRLRFEYKMTFKYPSHGTALCHCDCNFFKIRCETKHVPTHFLLVLTSKTSLILFY